MNSLIKKLDFLLKYRIKFFPSILLNNRKLKRRKILFYPRLPHHRTIIYKICKELGIKIISNPGKDYNILFLWEDKTYSDTIDLETGENQRSINLHCSDISKTNVDSTFEKVFGYGLSVEPKSYKGKCVVKSNINARHDGRIIDCPVDKTEESVVYQKIIDNTFDENFVKDIRVPVFGKSIPLVYYKFKKMRDRFTNDIDHVEVHETEDVLSQDEINKIIEFSKAMSLDYGELDVLRNKEDGKIYIVDVNKTPWGPPATISKEKAKYVIAQMCDAFVENFIEEAVSKV